MSTEDRDDQEMKRTWHGTLNFHNGWNIFSPGGPNSYFPLLSMTLFIGKDRRLPYWSFEFGLLGFAVSGDLSGGLSPEDWRQSREIEFRFVNRWSGTRGVLGFTPLVVAPYKRSWPSAHASKLGVSITILNFTFDVGVRKHIPAVDRRLEEKFSVGEAVA